MKCSEVMKRDFFSVTFDESLQGVAVAMLQRGISFVPVVDQDFRFVGAVTERGLLAQVVASGRPSHDIKAGNVAHELPTVSPEEEQSAAESKMAAAHRARAAVVDAEGHLLGIIAQAKLQEPKSSPDADGSPQSLQRQEA